jgi:Tfp pilus assembly protein PilN
VIRFNYLQPPFERWCAGIPAVTLARSLRVPLLLMGFAFLGVAATWTYEVHRAALLQNELSALQLRIRAAASDERRARSLMTGVARMRSIRTAISAARRDVLVATNTIARIGNDLPPATWLTSVGSTPAGAWTIGGRSTRVDEIGTMLRRVQGIDQHAAVRLVSIAATGRSGRVLDFVIGWDRRP